MKKRTRKKRRRNGSASVIAVVLLVVILAMGVIVGTVSIRDALVQEFGDIAVSLDNLDQSFGYQIDLDPNADGNIDFTISAAYIDPAPTLTDPLGAPPAGLAFPNPSTPEAPVPAPPGLLP